MREILIRWSSKIDPIKINNQSTISVFLMMAIFACQPVLANEEEQEDGIALQMIEVVGQATSGLDNAVTEEELSAAQAKNLRDIFSGEPSVSAGGSVNMGQKIYVRSIGEDIINITVDGAEQANAVFHHSGRLALEPELLKRVEIEAGAGSATVGPGALGGAVNFITKDPADLLQPDQNIGGILSTGYVSNGEGYKVNATLYGRDNADRFSAVVSLTGSEADNLSDGNRNAIIGSESEQTVGYAKVVANITDEQYLSLSHEQYTQEGDILYKPELIAIIPRNIPEPTEGERTTSTLNYGYVSENNDWLDLKLTLYNTEHFQDREYTGISYDGGVESTGLTIQNTSQLANHELVYGINYRDDKSYLNDVDFAPNSYFEEQGEVKGLYIQDIIDVTDQLTVSTGLRYDDYRVEYTDKQHLIDSGVSPNLSANYAITPSLSISAGYAEALRGAEVEDAFRLSSSSNDENLKAESASNTEVGLDYQHDRFTMGVGVYKTEIENAILRTPPWSSVVTNLDEDIETLGFFISTGYRDNKVDITAKYLSSDTEVSDEIVTRYVYGSKATSIGDTLVLDALYKFNNKIQAGWSAEFVKGIYGIEQNVGGENLRLNKPGYAVHDMFVRWLPLKDDSLALDLRINNVFDKQYISHASVEDYQLNAGYAGISGSAETGRDIRLNAKFSF